MCKENEKCSSEQEQVLQEPTNIDDIADKYLGSEDDTVCGIGRCRGGALQFLANPAVYLITSSLIALVQGLFYTYSNATLSTVEKDFGLPSRISGLTTTGNDVIQLLLALPLPFFASRGHRPRWLAFGMFLSCVGCTLAMSPHFIFPSQSNVDGFKQLDHQQQQLHLSETMTCNNINQTTLSSNYCKSFKNELANRTTEGVVALLLIAQMLAGVATLLYYTIGYSYMDEAVAKENVPLFLSISGAMRLLGPVCGYSLASKALSIWKYPSQGSNVPFTPEHPRWVGAWWLGYVVIGSVLLAISWVLLLLPKTLPSSRKRKLKELRNAAQKGTEDLLRHICLLRPAKSPKWNDMLSCGKRLATNAVYRLIVIKQMLFWFAFFGYITFKSKYLEHQFRLSAAEANRYIAGVSLVAALVGWLGTGASLSYFKPRPKSVIMYMALLSLISCLSHVGQLAISCDRPTIEGLDGVMFHRVTSPDSSRRERSTNSCEEDCGCVSEQFSPVCFNKSTTFFNSCFEKCSNFTESDTYINEDLTLQYESKTGFCSEECPSFIIYLIVSVLAKMAHAASLVPVNILLLRCADERDKDLGLGIFNAMIALGSSIPAPILFGWAIDSSCILWNISCKGKMACWVYDVDAFRTVIHGIPAGVLFLCVLMDLLLLRHHSQVELYSTKDSARTRKNPANQGSQTQQDDTHLELEVPSEDKFKS